MSRYRRAKVEGGVFFFTVTLADRSSELLIRHVDRLRRMYASVQKRNPFETIAICVLPDHLHAIWELPEGDSNFSLRWSLIKSGFSRGLDAGASPSVSKLARREKGIWQRRYWNMRSAMITIWSDTSTTFTSTPSSTDTCRRSPTGRTARSIVTLSVGFFRPTGAATCGTRPPHSANDCAGPRGHGASRLCPPYGCASVECRRATRAYSLNASYTDG
jgi:REP element-mobilizing transposase RayT